MKVEHTTSTLHFSNAERVHLLGVGGVGMSALATLLSRKGCVVSGSDRNLETPNIRFLRSIGVACHPDDGSGVDASLDAVVASTAIEGDNPALVKAKELGVPVFHRAAALSAALADKKLVAVVGTCGKSTVTAMLGHVLAECGLDPLCVNGANVPGWEGAVRYGRGEYAVAEVDESDKSLVAFHPYAAIVTNSSADHYSKEEMDEVFDAFVKGMPGPLVDGRHDRGIVAGEVECSLPGRHNRENAANALRMALALGCDEKTARLALTTFGGVERRLQRITPPDAAPGVPVVYDDYAHNPEKIKAMWTTLAEAYPKGLCVVWRPHGYGPLKKMMEPLAAMFRETVRKSDRLILLPVYDAGGTADRSVSSADLLAMLGGVNAELADGPDAAFERMAALRGEYGAFATCGARDPALPVLAQRLAAAFSEAAG